MHQVVGPARDLVPRREDDAVPVSTGNAPLLLVVLVVRWVVVPAATVGFENGPRFRKSKVEPVRATLPLERELPLETGDPARNEKTACLDLQGGSCRVDRIEVIEELTESASAASSGRADTDRGSGGARRPTSGAVAAASSHAISSASSSRPAASSTSVHSTPVAGMPRTRRTMSAATDSGRCTITSAPRRCRRRGMTISGRTLRTPSSR